MYKLLGMCSLTYFDKDNMYSIESVTVHCFDMD